jgi:hypothetical protein
MPRVGEKTIDRGEAEREIIHRKEQQGKRV